MSGFFFPGKVVGGWVNVTNDFRFFYTKVRRHRLQRWEQGCGSCSSGAPRPRLHPTCCAAHQRLLLGFQKKATKGKSEPARFSSNQRSEFPPATSSVPFQIQEGSSTPVDPAEGKLARNRSSPQDSPRFFPSRVASDFETWNLNRSAVLFSRQVGCSCPASR